MKTLWLDRNLTRLAGYYALFLTEQDLYQELKRLEVPVADWPAFTRRDAHATTYLFPDTPEHRELAMVCLPPDYAKGRDPIEVAGILVHEAVHVWQAHARSIGSFNDHGDEEEAYAIQHIAQQLMWSYREQTK